MASDGVNTGYCWVSEIVGPGQRAIQCGAKSLGDADNSDDWGAGTFWRFFRGLNVALGVAPVEWGILIDATGARQIPGGGGVIWTQFNVLFGLVAAAFVVAHRVAGGIEEKAASRTNALVRELLIHEARRFLTRFWLR